MKFAIASAFLSRGLTLGTQTGEPALRELLSRLHPVTTEIPLVRIGCEGQDGGYLVPDDFEGVAACFSPGVGMFADFETAMIERGIPCYLADASVEKAPISGPLVNFDCKFLGVTNNQVTTTLDSWVDKYAPSNGDLVLQMDIEGSEWAVLLNTSEETLQRFRMIVLEMHDLDRLIDKVGYTLIGNAFERLLAHFHVIHHHPNNWDGVVRKGDIIIPRVMEATLLRKDRATATGHAKEFPHPLDRTNRPGVADIPLPKIWYRA